MFRRLEKISHQLTKSKLKGCPRRRCPNFGGPDSYHTQAFSRALDDRTGDSTAEGSGGSVTLSMAICELRFSCSQEG